MTLRIIGGDVCRGSLVCWELGTVPKKFKEHFKENKRKSTKASPDPLQFHLNSLGVADFVSFLEGSHPLTENKVKANALIMEPTGVHYSWLFAKISESHGVPVRWVGHQEAVFLRRQERLPDKNDQADALALASYALSHWDKGEFFLNFYPFPITRIRELFLQLRFLNRIQSPLINRGKQQLSREFPEAATMESQLASDGLSPLWAWLAGEKRELKRDRDYYGKLYKKSIAVEYGVELCNFTRTVAGFLCNIHRWELKLKTELCELLAYPEFEPYMRVFDRYGFKLKVKAILLSQIYPISRFDNLGGFKRRLGFGQVEESSGDKKGFRKGGGSQLCKVELNLWVYTCIVRPERRISADRVQEIGRFYDERLARFTSDPQVAKIRAIEKMFKAQEKLIESMERQAKIQGSSMMEAQVMLMRQNLDLTKKTMVEAIRQGVNVKIPQAEEEKAGKNCGMLVACQTAAFSLRRLFKDLKQTVL
ncbi:MAG: hypothetical protein ACRC8A_12130 [Microcoleaceae cyanobacterium]